MDDYAGRVLADRYRLPLPPADEYELAETRAFDTYSGQEVLVRQVPLPEIVEAEVLGDEAYGDQTYGDEAYGDGDLSDVLPGGLPKGFRSARGSAAQGGARRAGSRATRRPSDPAVLRAIEAAQAAARIPDHPRLDQIFDVFAEDGSLWIVSERVAARPLAALLADKPLDPFRAAELAADVVTALRVLHAHGWVHRNITARTVLVCDDGRVMLTGLAAGAAEEALCGYDPRPEEDDFAGFTEPEGGGPLERAPEHSSQGPGPGSVPEARASGDDEYGDGGPDPYGDGDGDEYGGPGEGDGARGHAAIEAARHADDSLGGAGAETYGGTEAYGGFESPGGAGAYGGTEAYGGAEGYAGSESPGGAGVGAYGGMETYAGPESLGGAEVGAYGGAEAYAGSEPPGGSDSYGGTERAAGADPYAGSERTAGPEGSAGGGQYGTAERDLRAARAGAIAAYRAGAARAAARVSEAERGAEAAPLEAADRGAGGHMGHIADPYGVRERQRTPWHGAVPRTEDVPAQGTPGARGTHDPQQAHETRHAPSARPSPARALTEQVPPARRPAPPTPAPQAAPAVPAAREGNAADATDNPDGHPRESGWGDPAGERKPRRGPTTALAAERARHARMTVVGAVTERWAPEQAGPVHENWQLAAPIGPATDLWALGALLFRAVQGHAPYPEDSTAELVQLVCAEPPAFAEECGPLRPVVESLLRQDPTERIDFEELSGWLRSLVRSAPEPEAGAHVVPAPAYDGGRLPVVRRRGEMVRKRRPPAPVPTGDGSAHGRHKRGRERDRERARDTRPVRAPRPERAPRSASGPRSLGRLLLVVILAGLVAAVAYAMLFMPESDEKEGAGRTGNAGEASTEPSGGHPSPDGEPGGGGSGGADGETGKSPAPEETPGSQEPQTTDPDVAAGFTVRKDTEGFRVAVANGWDRQPKNGRGQVVYTHGSFELLVVPGRDSTGDHGTDPMKYQKEDERELQPFRDSSWATSSGLRRVDVGGRSMAEGQFTWQGADGAEVYVRNLAMVVDGKYHVLQVRGPEAERDEVTRLYEQASSSYRVTG
ncbi:protein kinase [Streptomyces sp. NPDC017940]|uniref:protein kinase n=1 Tax=Streptomyces sp. NPDC017940 TaxID=3365017 RepID=UPI0037975D62